MASLKVKKPATTDVDHFLDVALRDWQMAAKLDDLDPVFVEGFLADWPVVEDLMAKLARLESEGLMSPAQCQKYAQVRRLEAEYRPVVESEL
jgi:hypothetical protein